MRGFGKLNVQKINSLIKQGPGRHGDGNGLYLLVAKGGSASWVLRYQHQLIGHDMGLGGYPRIGLSQARQKALEAYAMRTAIVPVDPLTERKRTKDAKRAEAAKRVTFREAATKYIEQHRASWKSETHARQWPSCFEAYAHPIIGNLPVASIETGHIVRILEPIWQTKTETASRVRGRIEAVLDWAKVRGYRSGDNPARWKGHLENSFPARNKVQKVRHQPAMPYKHMAEFMAELRSMESISARALELTILTAVRTGEAINAQWSEFDLDKQLWVIPAERTKAGREHRVPLSQRTVEILEALPREKDSPWVFPGGRARQPLSNMAMLELLRGMRPGLVVHGFRSTFRDWAAEQTSFAGEVAEAALGHVVGDKVEAAYRRGDLFEKRGKLMAAWSAYLLSPPKAAADNVTAIRQAVR